MLLYVTIRLVKQTGELVGQANTQYALLGKSTTNNKSTVTCNVSIQSRASPSKINHTLFEFHSSKGINHLLNCSDIVWKHDCTLDIKLTLCFQSMPLSKSADANLKVHKYKEVCVSFVAHISDTSVKFFLLFI